MWRSPRKWGGYENGPLSTYHDTLPPRFPVAPDGEACFDRFLDIAKSRSLSRLHHPKERCVSVQVFREARCFEDVWEVPKSCPEWKISDHYGAIRVGHDTGALTAPRRSRDSGFFLSAHQVTKILHGPTPPVHGDQAPKRRMHRASESADLHKSTKMLWLERILITYDRRLCFALRRIIG